MILTLEKAEEFVQKNFAYSWNNYTIEQFIPNPRAVYSNKGVYRNRRWGFLNKYDVNDQGVWTIEHRRTTRS